VSKTRTTHELELLLLHLLLLALRQNSLDGEDCADERECGNAPEHVTANHACCRACT
jgi:hypothetical protein